MTTITINTNNHIERNLASELLAEVTKDKSFAVSYYEKGYYPDLTERTGRPQSEHLYQAEEDLKNWQTDVRDYMHWIDNGIDNKLRFEYYSDAYQAILATMKRYYDEAQDFSENIFIVMRALRKIVTLKNYLVQIRPAFEAYRTKYICQQI